MKSPNVILSVLLLGMLFSCKPKVPGEYLQPGEFEDILYDYHLADAMATGGEGDVPYNMTLYRQAVLRKHGVTQAEFDSSLVYYTRHADKLHDVYEGLTKRLENEAVALGASANDIRRYGDMTSSRDTSNMWTGVPATMLMPEAPYNVMTFEIAADSTYHGGDRLILSFNADFLNRNGRRNGIALLAVQFKNDSVASSTVRMSSNSNFSVTVSDAKGDGIKTIRGFFYLGDSRNEESSNDLSLMFIRNIRLVRMRGSVTKSPEPAVFRPVRTDTAVKSGVQPGGRLVPAARVVGPVKVSETSPSGGASGNKPLGK